MIHLREPLITDDAVVAGILMVLLALVFQTGTMPRFKTFYKVIPGLLLCYFLPSLLTTSGIIAPYWYDLQLVAAFLTEQGANLGPNWTAASLEAAVAQLGITAEDLQPFRRESQLYYVASRYFLPASLVLLTLSISMRELIQLGPKALIMFLAGTIGVVLGGPLAILLFSWIAPDVVGGAAPHEVWRGMTTIAGSWIGGGANQAAMYEIFKEGDKNLITPAMYSTMITVDIIVAEIWMVFLLLGVGRKEAIDRFFKADNSAVLHLQEKMDTFQQLTKRVASLPDLMVIMGIAFGATGLSHLLGNFLGPWFAEHHPEWNQFSLNSSFLWIIVIATTLGLALSFTKARSYEGAGASRIGGVFIYVLVATIGMKMNVLEIFDNPGLFGVGLVWMAFHVGVMVVVAKLIRAPYFFLAVGSKANIGGAASAPVVAAAFHPSLAPVGVLLAVLGYALGTYGGWISGLLMQMAAPH